LTWRPESPPGPAPAEALRKPVSLVMVPGR